MRSPATLTLDEVRQAMAAIASDYWTLECLIARYKGHGMFTYPSHSSNTRCAKNRISRRVTNCEQEVLTQVRALEATKLGEEDSG